MLDENKTLKQDNEFLRNQLLNVIFLREENQVLKELLNYKEEKGKKYISSRIYISTDNPFTKLAIINKGINHGLKKGAAVVTAKGLVGRVLKISKNNSHILLINSFNS